MFPLTITLTITSAADLARLHAFLGGAPDAARPEKPRATPAPTAAPAVQEAAKAAAEAVAAPIVDFLEYSVLQAAVFRLAKKAPAKCQEACSRFNIKTMKDLPAEKRREALAVVEAFIAEVGA